MEKQNSKPFESDGISEIDLLNREPFAIELANNIASSFFNGSESLTIGITGEWGTGKSNFLHFLKKHIEQSKSNENQIIYIPFYPWSYPEESDLQFEFYKVLRKRFGDDQEEIRNRIKKLQESTAKYIDYVPSSAAQSALKIANNAIKKAIESPTPLENRKEISDLIEKQNIQIVIGIDEVDRLTPNQVFQIIRIIKSSNNFSNTIFLLCYDEEKLIEIIKEKYKNYGENYLEKIIQVQYSLPEISKNNFYKYFESQIRKLGKTLNLEFDIDYLEKFWNWYGLSQLITNLRDIKRLCNSLRLRLNSIHNNININDFLILECIKLKSVEDYKKIFNGIRSEITPDDLVNKEDSWESSLSNKHVISIIQKLREQLPTYIYSQESKKHLFDKNYFYRYFTLLVPDDEIRDDEFKAFIVNADKRKQLLKLLEREGKIENLLLQLRNPNLFKEYKIDFKIITDLLELDKTINFDFKNKGQFISAFINILSNIDLEFDEFKFRLKIGHHDWNLDNLAPFFVYDELIYLHSKSSKSVLATKEHPEYTFYKNLSGLINELKKEFDNMLLFYVQKLFKENWLDFNKIDTTFLNSFLYQFTKRKPNLYKETFKHLTQDIERKDLFQEFVVYLASSSLLIWWENEQSSKIVRYQEGSRIFVINSSFFLDTLKKFNANKYPIITQKRVEKFIEEFENSPEKLESKL